MNQRYQQGQSRGRQGGRPEYDDGRRAYGRGERFDRQYEDDSPRGRDTEDMSEWQAGGRGERYGMNEGYALYEDEASYGDYGNQARARGYESMRGPSASRYSGSAYGPEDFNQGAHGGMRNMGGGYANDDYRQGSGQRQWQQGGGNFARRGQRDFVGQGGLGASNADQDFGYANFRQSRYQAGYSQSQGGMARDYAEGDYDQGYGGYSPSQRGYGQSWSGYGRGGYGTTAGQDFDDSLGTSTASYQSGAYGQGPGGYGGGFSQGLAGRGGYGMGSGFTGQGYGAEGSGYAGMGQRESQFGKGPKGYVRSDERLKEDLSERLMRDHDVDASDIDIDVRNGKVTLTGSIDDRRLKHYIEDTVEACTGVKEIDNRLTVRPRASRPQGGSGSLGGSTGDGGTSFAGQSSASGTTGTRASTGTANSTTTGASGSNSDDGTPRSRN
jgi:osmotically-inducible protein OsmY